MNDLELLREIFKDTRLHIGIGTIIDMGVTLSQAKLQVMVRLLPEEREVVAEMSWPDVYTVTFPEINDLALVVFVDGHPEEAFVIGLVSTKEEPLPKFSLQGHSVMYARPGKKIYLGSDTKGGIARPGTDPTEPLVLGNVLVAALGALVDAFLNATQIGQSPAGPVVLDPALRTVLTSWKTQYLSTAATNIISQLFFTERGV